MDTTRQTIKDNDIAIIGMSGRFPGAKNISEFWENLKHGVISIKKYSDEELIENEVNMLDLQNPNYVRAKGTIEDVEYFDAAFFDYSGREAEILDPQTRLLTELSWHALEDAGYVPDKFKGDIGVYVGITNNLYWQLKMIASGKITDNETLSVAIYSEKDHVSTRISYKLNLKGPSFTVETQCSTSLVSFHLACQGILSGECDMAITGGASINFPNKAGYIYQEGSIHSKDGICRAFDDNANGTVFSDGAGLVVLKSAKKAIADGDNIYAIVKGSAINNDGQDKAGYTAPSVAGQKDVITKAYKKAGVSPETITYIEAHGTGTAIGDPIEVEALTQAFGTTKRGYCRIGSVKPNVGHLDNAAGIANVIKATLAIKNKQLPPSVNYNKANAKIRFEETPFIVNEKLTEWKENADHPRRAGVSSYGVGGTNAHVVLEEYIAPSVSAPGRADRLQLVPVSAKTESSFQATRRNIANVIQNNDMAALSDVAFTLQNGRKNFQYRSFALGSSSREMADKLKELQPTAAIKQEDIKTIFLFPGQGAQYINMGKELYHECELFRNTLDKCFAIYQQMSDVDLRAIVFEASDESKNMINQTRYVQPLIFSYEYALSTVLMEAGIKPDYMIGHSIGEYTAACISGVFDLKDAMRLVVKRGELMQSLPKGSMMAVMMDADELRRVLPANISIAAVNSTNMSVVSGTDEDIEAFEQALKKQNKEGRRLHTSHAFHSHMMEPILAEFEQLVQEIKINSPKISYLSNLTGQWIDKEAIRKPSYWSAHLRNAVLFKDGLQHLLDIENAIFVEVGPGNTLATFVKRISPESRNKTIFNTMRHPQENTSDLETLYTVLGRVWQKGIEIEWNKVFDNSSCRKVSLPAYAFEPKKYWVKGDVYQLAQTSAAVPEQYKAIDKIHNRWIYKPTWVEAKRVIENQKLQDGKVSMVFSDDSIFTNSLVEMVGTPIVVKPGKEFQKSADAYLIDCTNKGNYRQLFEELQSKIGGEDINILHCWTLNATHEPHVTADKVKEIQSRGLMSILYIVQCISTVFPKNKINIKIVSNNIHNVLYKDLLNPLNATLLGAVTTVPIEYKNISVRSIDVDIQHLLNPLSFKNALHTAILLEGKESIVALRGEKLFERTFESVPFKHDNNLPAIIKENGVYVVTGGLGGLGIELATYLSKIAKVKLALIGRSEFPDRSKWSQLVKSGGDIANKIRRIQEIEGNGTQVMVLSSDIADKGSMRSCVDRIQNELGSIHGVLHCAGIAGGNIIQTLEPEYIYETMASKVFGTLILNEIINLSNIDFVVLCSSISSITGTFGQLSYTASNSFLDAFAHFRNSFDKKNIICFNWDIWQEVGMATKAMKELTREDDFKIAQEDIIAHPLFSGSTKRNNDHVFISYMRPDIHWVMNEHRILKQPVLPGATYIEMLGVIAAHQLKVDQFKIQNLNFFAPFAVDDNAEKQLYSVVREDAGAFSFSVREKYSNEKEGVCAKGRFERADIVLTDQRIDVKKIISRCNKQVIVDAEKELNKDTSFLQLGKRWRCLRSIHLGETEGIAVIEMPDVFSSDFLDYKFHPAILDIAFNYFAAWKIGQSEYLPFSYKNLNVYKPVTAGKLYSYIRQNDNLDQLRETISFKVDLVDEAGDVIITIEEYILKKVYSEKVKTDNSKFNLAGQVLSQKDTKDALLQEGIKSEEGAKIFDKVVSNFLFTGSSDYSQLVVSNNNLSVILNSSSEADAYSYFKPNKSSDEQPFIDRPELSNLFEPPLNDIQERLCKFFQNYLRINDLGIQDNFFELGISSLDVVEIKIGVEEKFGIELPVAVIFENPNIKALGKFIAKELGEEEAADVVHIVDRSAKVKEGRKLLQKRLQNN